MEIMEDMEEIMEIMVAVSVETMGIMAATEEIMEIMEIMAGKKKKLIPKKILILYLINSVPTSPTIYLFNQFEELIFNH